MADALSPGFDWFTGKPVTVPGGGNIAMVGSSGSGSSETMKFMVADAVGKGWDVALSTPKYDHPGGEFPGAAEHPNVDLLYHHTPGQDFRDLGLGLSRWIDGVPTGTPERPRLVVLDSFQATALGDEQIEKPCLGSLARLLGNRDTTVLMRMQVIGESHLPHALARSIDTAISMGRVDTAYAERVMDLVGTRIGASDLFAFTRAGKPLGYGVLAAADRIVTMHTPKTESVKTAATKRRV